MDFGIEKGAPLKKRRDKFVLERFIPFGRWQWHRNVMIRVLVSIVEDYIFSLKVVS